MPRQKKPTHQPFEGHSERGAFTKITHEMMNSPAWKDLTLRQQGLYLHMKAKYREKKSYGYLEHTNINDISLPKSEWCPKLYTGTRSFYKDMGKLIENGFIRVISRGGFERKCNIYGFTDEWFDWIPPPK